MRPDANIVKLVLMVAVLMLVLPTGAQALALGYGYTVQNGGNGHLYQIDLTTGQATDLGVIGWGYAKGLAFANGQLYTIGGFYDQFWNITLPPGTEVGATGEREGKQAGLDYNPVTGKMYNINSVHTTSPLTIGNWLYEINMSTGAATLVGTGGNIYVDGLAINSAGQAYASDFKVTQSLYSVNLGTGALNLVGSLGVPAGDFYSGLSFDGSGQLWALASTSGKMYTINTTTGAATFMFPMTRWSDKEEEWEAFGDSAGLAIAIPAPATLLLLGSGLLGLIGFKGRQWWGGSR